MNKLIYSVFSLLILVMHCTYCNGQDFLNQNQKQKVRAYSVPIGSTTPFRIIGDSSQTYKITTPKFDKAVKLFIWQSDYNTIQSKLTDHLLYENDYKQGESMFFSMIINEKDQKQFILVPNSFMGQLNFPCDKDEIVKYLQVETANNSSFIFYIDNKKNEIEAEIGKYKQGIKITDDSDLDQVLQRLDRFYMIHYKYE